MITALPHKYTTLFWSCPFIVIHTHPQYFIPIFSASCQSPVLHVHSQQCFMPTPVLHAHPSASCPTPVLHAYPQYFMPTPTASCPPQCFMLYITSCKCRHVQQVIISHSNPRACIRSPAQDFIGTNVIAYCPRLLSHE